MIHLRSSKYYYFKGYNIPINTFKYVFFNRLKNNFGSILLTQTNENSVNMMRCTHHIAIQYESRVKPEYVADIISSTYQSFTRIPKPECLKKAFLLNQQLTGIPFMREMV